MKTMLLLLAVVCSALPARAQWWQPCNNGLDGGSIHSVAVSGNYIFVGGNYGKVFISTNQGESWREQYLSSGDISQIAASENLIAAISNVYYDFNGAGSALFFSSDYGSTWNIARSSPSTYILSVAFVGKTIIIGVAGGGIYVSENYGSTWIQKIKKTNTFGITRFAVSGNVAVAGTTGPGIFVSTDSGSTWAQKNIGISGISAQSVVVNGSEITVGTSRGVFISKDYGSAWRQHNYGLTDTNVTSLAASENAIIAGTNDGVFFSTDNGNSWTQRNNGLTAKNIQALAVTRSSIIAGTVEGAFISKDNGSSWIQKNKGLSNLMVWSLYADGNTLIAGTYEGGVFISTDKGNSWTQKNKGLTSASIRSITKNGATLFAGTRESGVFTSTDYGASWKQRNNGITDPHISSLISFGTITLAGTVSKGIFSTADYGESWANASVGLTSNFVNAFMVYGNSVYVAVDGFIFSSTDSGNSWLKKGAAPTFGWITALVAKRNILYIGMSMSDGNGIYASKNDGKSWSPVERDVLIGNVNSLVFSDNYLLAGTYYGVFMSGYYSNSPWQQRNEGLQDPSVLSMVIVGADVFIGTNGGVYRRSLADLGITTVEDFAFGPSGAFTLAPNPAADNFTLRFPDEPAAPFQVKISSVLGQTIHSQELPAGAQTAGIDTRNLTAGVYAVTVEGRPGAAMLRIIR